MKKELWRQLNCCKEYSDFKDFYMVSNRGRIIGYKGNVFYMTDTGTADHIKGGSNHDYYFIEANYREEQLKSSIEAKIKSGLFTYETRVADTHLSEEQAIRFISENAKPDSKVIYMHKHIEKEENSA